MVSEQAKAVMDALWPVLGGNHTDAETWQEISRAVEAALPARPTDGLAEAVKAFSALIALDSDGTDGCAICPIEYGEALDAARTALAKLKGSTDANR